MGVHERVDDDEEVVVDLVELVQLRVDVAVEDLDVAYGDGISYWPLAELLKAYAKALDSDTIEIWFADEARIGQKNHQHSTNNPNAQFQVS